MSTFTIAFAVVIITLGLWGVWQPVPLLALVDRVWTNRKGILLAVCLRLVFGVALVLVAAETRFPMFIQALGVVVILAAIAAPLFGTTRIQAAVIWWKSLPTYVVRVWAAFAVLFGAFVLYAVI